MNMQSVIFDLILTILSLGTATFARHPHTFKNLYEGFRPFHFS